MKLLLILLTLSTGAFAQDKELFDYVNVYRDANDVASLVWNDDLHSISEGNTQTMFDEDSLMHSGTNTYECSVREFTIAPTYSIRADFDLFLSKYYGMTYKIPTTEENITEYILLYAVYKWHSSPEHRKVMLSDDAEIGSASINIGEVTYKSNHKVIGGKKIVFSKFVSHYEVKFFATLNLNI